MCQNTHIFSLRLSILQSLRSGRPPPRPRQALRGRAGAVCRKGQVLCAQLPPPPRLAPAWKPRSAAQAPWPDICAQACTSIRRGFRLAAVERLSGEANLSGFPTGSASRACSCSASLSSTSRTQRRNDLATGVRANMARRWHPRRVNRRLFIGNAESALSEISTTCAMSDVNSSTWAR